jgi:hypothetical protein
MGRRFLLNYKNESIVVNTKRELGHTQFSIYSQFLVCDEKTSDRRSLYEILKAIKQKIDSIHHEEETMPATVASIAADAFGGYGEFTLDEDI